LFNFNDKPSFVTWYIFKENGFGHSKLYDHWTEKNYMVGKDNEHLIIEPYGFHLMEDL
jgi:amylosucrase